MDINDLIKSAARFLEESELNYISKEIAISEEVVGLKIFNEPIFGVSSVDDDYYNFLKNPSIIGDHFLLPKEWLPEAKSVISFFLPFTEAVRASNRIDRLWTSDEWAHGYVHGQKLLIELSKFLTSQLIKGGYNSLIPYTDSKYWTQNMPKEDSLHPEVPFTSNWSERHVAFISGLGTFGLSKGIITEKGMAGRLSSIITELSLPPTERKYSDILEYCTMCGSCIINCPPRAITMEDGKNHIRCSKYLNAIAKKFNSRRGCGKCQVSVPCESRIP